MDISSNIVLPSEQVKLPLFYFIAYLQMFYIDTRQDLARSDCTDGLSDWMNESNLFIYNKLKNFHLLFYVSRILCMSVFRVSHVSVF